ncbi:hypothetical protein J6590_013919 [Homalodisca vitripennis]|nr:hypothetical protein J6590_013919 [Homalodisca vitripennis]
MNINKSQEQHISSEEKPVSPSGYSVGHGEEFTPARSAGSVVAIRLTEIENWKVLLLEVSHKTFRDSRILRLYNKPSWIGTISQTQMEMCALG